VANLEAALLAPEVKRTGHALFAAVDLKLFDIVAESGVSVAVGLSSNLVLVPLKR
jgi:hypothetical protein